MKQAIVVIVLMWAARGYTQSCLPDINFWGDFEGDAGNKKIVLSVFRLKEDSIVGNYRLADDDKKIFTVQGIISNCTYSLAAMDDDKPAGKFVFSFTTDKTKRQEQYTGTYTSTTHEQSKLTLQLRTMVGGTLSQRYFELFGTTNEVDSFAAKVKTAIAGNDVQWLSSNCVYPLFIYVGSHKPNMIKNKQEFFAAYKKFFTAAFKNKFAMMNCYNMLSNHIGAGMGRGEVWINNMPGSIAASYRYGISSVNIF